MNIKAFKASYADLSMVASPDSFYGSLKSEYQSFKENGFIESHPDEALYIYQIKRGKRKHLGLIACVDINDYSKGKILKHEHTLAEKEQIMTNLIFQRKAMIKPVLLTYPTFEPMKAWMHAFKKENDPFFQVKLEEYAEKHSLWRITDRETIERFEKAFRDKIGKAYIADGHHRSSTTWHLHQAGQGQRHHLQFDQLFAAFFDFEELEIYDYNRVVDVLGDVSVARFMAGISQYCDIEPLAEMRKPLKKHEMTLCISGEWYALTWRKKLLEKFSSDEVILDTFLLDELIFKAVIGIEDVKSDSRLSYVEGTKDIKVLQQKVHKNPNCVAFCLYPVALEEVIHIAEDEKVMPPKSTWFEPRIRNGMLILDLQAEQ